MIGLWTYGHYQAEHAFEEGGLEKQVIVKATMARMEVEAFAAKRRVPQVADDKLKQRKTGSTLELLKKTAQQEGNLEATKLLTQPSLVSTLVKRMCAPRAPSAQDSRKIALLIKRFIYEGRFMVLSRRQQVL